MEDKSYLQFHEKPYFQLAVKGRGKVQATEILLVLESVVDKLYQYLDVREVPKVLTLIVPCENRPEILIRSNVVVIRLSAKERDWTKYIYQFSHELCHYVIHNSWSIIDDRYGWFEESICQLASVFILQNLPLLWESEPRYIKLLEHANNLRLSAGFFMIVNEAEDASSILSEFIEKNIARLQSSRYLRAENEFVAIQLFNIFDSNPEIWSSLPYLGRIDISRVDSFRDFICEWQRKLPRTTKEKFAPLRRLLIGA